MLKPSVHQTPMNTKKRERTESIIVVDDEEDGKQEESEEKKVVVVKESKKPAGRAAAAALSMKIPMILSNLPVKSLLRFRLVCKQWNKLIKNPIFIQSHLRKTIEKAKFKLLIKPCGHEYFASIDYYRDSSVSLTLSYKPSELHNPFDKFEVHTFSSVNGLVFLEGICLEKDNLCLWNPATKEYKMVVKPKVEEPVSNPNPVLYAFGYAPSINDYKIVRARKCYKPCGNVMVCIGCQVLVYSLRADSWKKPRQSCVPYDIHMYDNIDKYVHSFEIDNARLNGKIFWKATRCNVAGSVAVIIMYNTGDDTIKEIPVSPDVEVLIREGVMHRNLLGIMDGKVCIMNRHLDGTIDIWRMEDIETKPTWKKWCVIGRRNARKSLMHLEKPSFMKPIWDFKNGEVLFLENYSSLVVVDMKKNKRIRVIKIRGVTDENWLRAVPYFESLVPLNSGKYVQGGDQSLKGMKIMKNEAKDEEETKSLISAIESLVTGNHKRMKVEN